MKRHIDSTDGPPAQASGLYLVSTPIGNLRDITLRACDVLAGCTAVVCEDSRVTGRLLQSLGITAKLVVYNDHSTESERDALLKWIEEDGASLALVSDAGTPLLSDPGYKLVHLALARGLSVVPVPGANALLPALQLAGLPCDRFLFAGFLPHKSAARRTVFAELASVPATLVFYESPQRLHDCVCDAHAVLGDRPAATARELTKMYEESRRFTLAAGAADECLLGTMKGEIVLLVGPPVESRAGLEDIDTALRRAMETLSIRDAAAHVATATGAPKKQVYDRALRLKNGDD
ncbi:MAG: 16S rRNA (cytidine(1402)-2'-O)-methyltransferase [Alphaproteobacteria bacterium]|nr:16S rRNA (cytidine(1402)-2'-O)-methyltransferase [Alphaproteobacteria bacterium]USO07180.1 MAG: 16S rRNA (cytidine(1402)-2'-O)-methyltransferase [Rhodospirillales bacterium]